MGVLCTKGSISEREEASADRHTLEELLSLLGGGGEAQMVQEPSLFPGFWVEVQGVLEEGSLWRKQKRSGSAPRRSRM